MAPCLSQFGVCVLTVRCDLLEFFVGEFIGTTLSHSLTEYDFAILHGFMCINLKPHLWNEDQKAKREHLTEIFYTNKRMPCSVFPFRYGCFWPCAVHRVWIFGSVILSALQHGAVSMYLCSNLYIGFGRL